MQRNLSENWEKQSVDEIIAEERREKRLTTNARTNNIRSAIVRVLLRHDGFWDIATIQARLNQDRSVTSEVGYLSFSTVRYHLLHMVETNEVDMRVVSSGCYKWRQFKAGENAIPF